MRPTSARVISVDVAKSSLVGLLLETGEDDLAAVLAVSDLPDVLDIDRDREALSALGIPVDELVAKRAYPAAAKRWRSRGDTGWPSRWRPPCPADGRTLWICGLRIDGLVSSADTRHTQA
jgi:hypothetical protein